MNHGRLNESWNWDAVCEVSVCQPAQAEQPLCSGWLAKHVHVQGNLTHYQSTQYQGTPAPLTSQSKLLVCFEDNDLILTKSGRKIKEDCKRKRKHILSLPYSQGTGFSAHSTS